MDRWRPATHRRSADEPESVAPSEGGRHHKANASWLHARLRMLIIILPNGRAPPSIAPSLCSPRRRPDSRA